MRPHVLYAAAAAVAVGSAGIIVADPAPFLPLLVHRGLHLMAMVMLLGNAAFGALWLAQADLSKSLRRLHFSFVTLNRLDVWITAPASLLLTLNGAAMSVIHGGTLGRLWLLWGVGLFGAAGMLWGAVLVPMQLRLERECAQALAGRPESDDLPPAHLRGPLVRYFISGGTVGALLVSALWVMVFKPM